MAGKFEREQSRNSLKNFCHRHPPDGKVDFAVITGDSYHKSRAYLLAAPFCYQSY